MECEEPCLLGLEAPMLVGAKPHGEGPVPYPLM